MVAVMCLQSQMKKGLLAYLIHAVDFLLIIPVNWTQVGCTLY